MWWISLALSFPPADFGVKAYGGLPSWKGVASGLKSDEPSTHIIDQRAYTLHYDFVKRELRAGINRLEFGNQVRYASERNYLPFFVFDLTDRPARVQGAPRTWALQVQDYAYKDDDTSLGESVARLASLVADDLGLDPEDGFVVLASSHVVRPNTGSAGPVLNAGFAHAPLKALLKRGVQYEVLNEGTAVGRLRWPDGGEPGPTDIVVYETLPERVPPVAGVITLAPQTPLSHVNLLARNRGTPNVSLFDRELLPMDGTWVEMTATKKLSFVASTREDAEAWRVLNAPKTPELPRLDPSVGLVDLTTRPSAEQVGAKAANYGRLQALLASTRPGFALGFRVYVDHVRQSGADEAIASFLAEENLSPALIRARLAGIRHLIRTTDVHPDVLVSIRSVIDSLDVGRIRLRSSTNNEDLPGFNGAGLYTSKGFNRQDSDAKLSQQLTKVLASLWSEAAFQERTFYGVDHQTVGMAVLMHQAFTDELANGVAITQPRRRRVAMMVNAQPEDHSVANPEPGEVPEASRWDGRATTFTHVSTIGPVFAGPYAEQLADLHRQMQILHDAMVEPKSGYGIDVEFKVVDGPKVVIKQVRLLAPATP